MGFYPTVSSIANSRPKLMDKGFQTDSMFMPVNSKTAKFPQF
jgi:hypothetical protein